MLEPAEPQALNRYSYVDDNPLRYTDPSGQWAFEEDPYTPGRLYPPTAAYGPAHRKKGYDFYSDKEVSAGEMARVATLPFQAAAATVAFEGVIADVEVLGEVATTAWEKIAGTIASYFCLNGKCEDEAESIVEFAKSLQGNGRYPGVDNFEATVLQEGDIIVGALPEEGQTEFYTDVESLVESGLSKETLWQGLQVAKHKTEGYRTAVGIYRVTRDVVAATGRALANTDYGPGGLKQYVIREYKEVLELIAKVELK